MSVLTICHLVYKSQATLMELEIDYKYTTVWRNMRDRKVSGAVQLYNSGIPPNSHFTWWGVLDISPIISSSVL